MHYDAFVAAAHVAEATPRYVCVDAEPGVPTALPEALATRGPEAVPARPRVAAAQAEAAASGWRAFPEAARHPRSSGAG